MVDRQPIEQAMLVKLNSWEELFYLARIMKFGEWVFRGHAKADWKLSTSRERDVMPGDDAYEDMKDPEFCRDLARKMNCHRLWGDEKCVIDDFRRLTTDVVSDEDGEIGILATMQHYGTPTRLLDFTYSLGTALFFAYDRSTDRKRHALWAIRTEPLFSAVNDASKIHNDITDEKDENFWLKYDQKEIRDKAISLANLNIRNQGKGNWRDGVLLVTLPGNNKRLVAQNGLFLFPLTLHSFVHNLGATLKVKETEIESPTEYCLTACSDLDNLVQRTTLMKIVLPGKFGSEALNVMRHFNLNPAVFFPGIEGIARTVRYR